MSSPLVFGFNIDPMGHHNGAWRHHASDPSQFHSIEYEIGLAKMAEEAGFDVLFIADQLGAVRDEASMVKAFEPLTLFAAVASHTRYPGLVCTVSSTFVEPYNLARSVTSLDHISHGRVAWNIVTTGDAQAPLNYGQKELAPHAERYELARETAEASFALWDSWGEGSLLLDQEAGRFFDGEKVRPAAYRGRFRATEGPLNLVPGPQGRPVIVQAGQSADGRVFAARNADIVYMVAQHIDDAREYYDDIKRRVGEAGRNPEEVFVIMSVRVLVEPTEEAAKQRDQELFDLIPLEKTVANVSRQISVDLTQYDLDDDIPELPDPELTTKFQTQLRMIRDLVARGQVKTIRDLATLMNGGQGVLSITGSPSSVIAGLEEWANAGVTDGFMILPQQTQVDGANFVKLVVPLLKERGLMADEPLTEMTFRERLLRAAERKSS